jgi:hypothetical protein
MWAERAEIRLIAKRLRRPPGGVKMKAKQLGLTHAGALSRENFVTRALMLSDFV